MEGADGPVAGLGVDESEDRAEFFASALDAAGDDEVSDEVPAGIGGGELGEAAVFG